jgi:hypothetical protein
MAASTLATFTALLKERAEDSSIVEKLVYPENPLLGMLEKRGDTGMVGDKMPVPIFRGNPQGVASAFATAQTNATTTKSFQFDIEAGDYHGVVHIGDKVMMASRTNQGAYLENKSIEIDGLWETAGEMLSVYSWGNGGQALGRIAALDATTVTLEDSATAGNFEVDMLVVASADDGSVSTHALRDTADQTVITGINRATGVLTLTTGDISGLAVGDYLFREGDFFGDTGTVVIKGVQCFTTVSDSPMALWGIAAATRATDPQRYAGCRVDPTLLMGKSFEERIRILMSQMTGRFKAKAPTHGFMHPEDFETLVTLMQSKGIRALEDSTTKFGYTKIDVMTGAGNLPIYCDRHCPKGTFFAFRMDDWWISSMGELLHPQTSDGNQILRRATATDLEYRLISYPLLANRAPKNSGRVALV